MKKKLPKLKSFLHARHLPVCVTRVLVLILLFTGLTTAQAQSKQTVTINLSDVPVSEVFDQIKRQTDYTFMYNTAAANAIGRVSVNMSNATVTQVLDRCLANTSYTYQIEDSQVIIRPARAAQQPASTLPAAITGVVRMKDGMPIIGASVYVKGNAQRGTVTGPDGRYNLRLTGLQNPVIIVAFLGMKTHEFTPTIAIEYNVTLEEELNQIEGVTVTVNTGYQDIPRDRMTGAYSVVTAKELEGSSFMSIDQALQGKVAGLLSTSTTGEPGAKAEMRIRGDNSISGNNEPLWVVDGLPLQSGVLSLSGITSGELQTSILSHGVGNIAPSDIESVTILKDAASAAIYGASAAAGVIVIKTKKGSDGPLTVNYQGNFAINSAPKLDLEFMNSAEKVAYEIELAQQYGETGSMGTAGLLWNSWKKGTLTDAQYQSSIDNLSARSYDKFKEIFRNGFSHSHNISMRGGTNKFWFYSSLNIQDDKAILKTNRYNAFSASANVGYRPAEKLTIDVKVEGYYRESNNHNSSIDPFKYAVFANPYERIYNDDSSYAWDNTYLNNKSYFNEGNKYRTFNILNEMYKTKKQSMATDVSATLSINWQITDWLKAEGHGRVGNSVNIQEEWADVGTYTSYANYLLPQMFNPYDQYTSHLQIPESYNNGYMRGSTSRTPSFSFRGALSANREINDKHFLNLYAGTEIRSQEGWSDFYRTVEYVRQYEMAGVPQYPWYEEPFNIAMQKQLNSLNGRLYGNKDRYVSFFGAFTYSYEDRYVANFNVRFDGAGTIHAANRFEPLWSASVRWNLHRESFIRNNVSWISELAIRAVYGYTGKIDKNALPFPYVNLDSKNKWDGEYIPEKINYPNPSVKWEKKQERSIGLDFSLFNNIFGASFNYYNNKTKDLLSRTSAANSYGDTNPILNKGSLTNKGMEFNFNLRLRFGDDWRWTTSFNIARNINEITDTYYKSPFDTDNTTYWYGYTGAVQGYPNGTLFGYKFAGVNEQTGSAMIYLTDASRQWLVDNYNSIYKNFEDTPTTWDTEAGDAALPQSGSSYQTEFLMRSLQKLGSSVPEWHGGFGTTLQWKNLELRMNFRYETGGLLLPTFNERNESAAKGSDISTARLNRLRDVANRWRAPGDKTDQPGYFSGSSNYYYDIMITDDKYEKGDYLRFSDLAVNYNIRSKYLEKMGLNHIRIGFQIQNVATWTRYSGFDVTTKSAFSYPLQRRFLLNLQLSF